MNDTTSKDDELRKAVREFGKREVEFPGISGTVRVVATTEEVDNIMHLIKQYGIQERNEGEQTGAFMAGSAILTEMAPLMVHRLEANFPSMTGEVIGNVYAEVKKQMQPMMDKRKAELTALKDKDASDEQL